MRRIMLSVIVLFSIKDFSSSFAQPVARPILPQPVYHRPILPQGQAAPRYAPPPLDPVLRVMPPSWRQLRDGLDSPPTLVPRPLGLPPLPLPRVQLERPAPEGLEPHFELPIPEQEQWPPRLELPGSPLGGSEPRLVPPLQPPPLGGQQLPGLQPQGQASEYSFPPADQHRSIIREPNVYGWLYYYAAGTQRWTRTAPGQQRLDVYESLRRFFDPSGEQPVLRHQEWLGFPYRVTLFNLMLMMDGHPPLAEDGTAIELHHNGQQPGSPLIEMHWRQHRGPFNYYFNHQNTGGAPSQINRTAFAREREQHWQRRGARIFGQLADQHRMLQAPPGTRLQ